MNRRLQILTICLTPMTFNLTHADPAAYQYSPVVPTYDGFGIYHPRKFVNYGVIPYPSYEYPTVEQLLNEYYKLNPEQLIINSYTTPPIYNSPKIKALPIEKPKPYVIEENDQDTLEIIQKIPKHFAPFEAHPENIETSVDKNYEYYSQLALSTSDPSLVQRYSNYSENFARKKSKLSSPIIRTALNTCANSVDVLRTTKHSLGEVCGTPEDCEFYISRGNYSKKEKNWAWTLFKKYANAAFDYDKNCLHDHLSNHENEKQTLENLYASYMGVLRPKDGDGMMPDIFCSAFVYSDYYVITARHCFFDKSASDQPTHSFSFIFNNKLIFNRASTPNKDYKVVDIIDIKITEYSRIRFDEDFVFLKLEESLNLDKNIELHFEDVEVDDDLWVLGPFRYYDRRRIMKNGEMFEKYKSEKYPYWFKTLRTTKIKESCLVDTVNDRCFIHTCQSRFGYSGGPIVNVSKSTINKLVISGMLLGKAGELADCKSNTNQASALNLALSAKVISAYIDNNNIN